MSPNISIIPRPMKISVTGGTFVPAGGSSVQRRVRPELAGELGDEGYRLSVTGDGANIEAATDAGLFYGEQTLEQLGERELPCVEIIDRPRFGWRGLMLDPARDYYTPDLLKRYVEHIARLKFNRLHLHLTDDQGWRIEIERYPKLTEVGAAMPGAPSGFYTQDELRELVAFAAKRHVTIVPEIDLPGHSFETATSYPDLCCSRDPKPNPGHSKDLLCAGREETYRFLADVFEEVCDIFPSPFIHIGGDEAPKDRWRECPDCQTTIRREGLPDEEALQGYFCRRVADMLRGLGRRVIGWDEILLGGAPDDAVVQWWRSLKEEQIEPVRRAVAAGRKVIVSPNQYSYLNFVLTPDQTDPRWSRDRWFDLRKAYEADPVAMVAESDANVLGVSCCAWELPPDRLDRSVFPRIFAMAERAWSPAAGKDLDDFLARAEDGRRRLAALGVDCGPGLREEVE